MNKHFLINIGLAAGATAVFGFAGYVLLQPGVQVPPASEETHSAAPESLTPCGNGTPDPGEACDDGNPWVGDGCTQCQVEAGFRCQGSPSVCGLLPAGCGNGQPDAGEQCDDGNAADSDGCSHECRVEQGWNCQGQTSVCVQASSLSSTSSVVSPSIASSSSSSSTVVEKEKATPPPASSSAKAASSSSAAAYSSVASTSVKAASAAASSDRYKRMSPREIRAMFASSSSDSPYYHIQYEKPYCGDNLVLDEGCDDGNTASGDGCSATCTIEPGFNCFGNPTKCSEHCGNGVMTVSESCDDGNLQSGDGCSSNCRLEEGYACNTSTPNKCSLLTPADFGQSSSSSS